MVETTQLDELICLVATLDRESLSKQFAGFPGRFPVDFTPDFLSTQPLDRLRHIFVALCIQNQKVPLISQPLSPA